MNYIYHRLFRILPSLHDGKIVCSITVNGITYMGAGFNVKTAKNAAAEHAIIKYLVPNNKTPEQPTPKKRKKN